MLSLAVTAALAFSLAKAQSLVPTGTNLIQNGGFEDHADCSGAAWCIKTDSKFISPWYLAKGSKEYELDFTPWPAAQGKVSMDLSGNVPYAIAQDVSTVTGKQYRITFKLNENNCGAISNHTGLLEVSGSPWHPFWHKLPEKSGWKQETYDFTAASSKTKITLSSTTPTSCGPVIDDVQLFELAPAKVITTTTSKANPATTTGPSIQINSPGSNNKGAIAATTTTTRPATSTTRPATTTTKPATTTTKPATTTTKPATTTTKPATTTTKPATTTTKPATTTTKPATTTKRTTTTARSTTTLAKHNTTSKSQAAKSTTSVKQTTKPHTTAVPSPTHKRCKPKSH